MNLSVEGLRFILSSIDYQFGILQMLNCPKYNSSTIYTICYYKFILSEYVKDPNEGEKEISYVRFFLFRRVIRKLEHDLLKLPLRDVSIITIDFSAN